MQNPETNPHETEPAGVRPNQPSQIGFNVRNGCFGMIGTMVAVAMIAGGLMAMNNDGSLPLLITLTGASGFVALIVFSLWSDKIFLSRRGISDRKTNK